MQESRAKGLQTWTEQQVAAKQGTMQVTDSSQPGTNDWVCLHGAPQGLGESANSEGGCTADAQLGGESANDSQLEDVWADESQPEDYWGDDLQAEQEHDWDDESQHGDDCVDDLQPDDKSIDELQQEGGHGNHSQPDSKSVDDLQQGDDCANNLQAEGDCADGEAPLGPRNWPGCEVEEELVPLDAMPDCGQWDEEVQSDLCLSLSSDEEE